jgi:hypothetical protein
MPVVSNTSPILNLAIIDQLDLLRSQFDDVLIPPAVLAELKPETNLPGSSSIRRVLEAGWLYVTELAETRLSQALSLELDDGEAAAIALALQQGIQQILMDERDGRAKAKAMGLNPVGVLGILLRAKRDGALDSVASAVGLLRQEAGFFVAEDLLAAILREAYERE